MSKNPVFNILEENVGRFNSYKTDFLTEYLYFKHLKQLVRKKRGEQKAEEKRKL